MRTFNSKLIWSPEIQQFTQTIESFLGDMEYGESIFPYHTELQQMLKLSDRREWWLLHILGDPGAVRGNGKKVKRARKKLA